MKFVITMLVVISSTLVDAEEGIAEQKGFDTNPKVQAFIAKLVKQHGLDAIKLADTFKSVKRQTKVLEAISRPAEAKPWHEYRQIFITPKRIQEGVEYWATNRDLLDRAEQVYGVPPSIMVAIIGVETFYGRHAGKYRVLDSLTTLAFEYPPRSKFFSGELEQLFLLARDESLDVTSLMGSYAGAMGKGQFIPSSYRAYAVDFDNDGKRDMWSGNDDVIGSVASYFHRHHWRQGKAVVVQAKIKGNDYQPLLKKGMKPKIPTKDLEKYGIQVVGDGLDDTGKVSLLEFELEDGKEYWLGLDNFYVITRYNRSPLYAMAVYQLSEEIQSARERSLTQR